MRRSFDVGGVAAVGPVLADLVARLRLVPGSLLLADGAVTDSIVAFAANVVLVGGGQVVSPAAPDAAALLAVLAEQPVTVLAVAPARLDALTALPDDGFDDLDLLEVRAVIAGGAPLAAGAREAVEDRFGPGVLVDVLSTADTGMIGVRGEEDAFTLLDGVDARTTAAGTLEVRSPLAATTGWTATGDAATVAGRTVRLAR